MPLPSGRPRAAGRNGPADRMEQEEDGFYEAVRRGYLDLAHADPERFVIIDASAPEEVVEASIQEAIRKKCHGLF